MRAFLAGVALLAVTGCFPVETYHAEGVSIVTRDRDLAQCERAAARDFPIAQSIRQTPLVFRPGATVCDAAGACVTRPGYWSGGQTYSVDLNEAPRARAVVGCMAAGGYARIRLPACELDGPVTASPIMPALTGASCAVRRAPAGPLVLSPG